MRARPLVAVLWLVAACATTGDPGEGDRGLPSAGVGPFRKLGDEEVSGTAPFVLDDPGALYREPAVLRDGDATLLYAVATVGGPDEARDVIVRTRATDERSFFGARVGAKPPVVLEPDAPWEGALSGPSAVRFRGEVLLYYAGADGVGVARSPDGVAFAKVPGPILARSAEAGPWEVTPPRAPSVFALPDGRLRMLYVAGAAIGEAESDDGIAWRRLGDRPVLGPAPPPGSPLPGDKPPFDAAAVGDPCAVTRITPAGRLHVRVLYTGTGAAGATAIGLAARYGADGALERQAAPVYAVGQGERAPALLDLGATSFLYVEQLRRVGSRPPYAAIAAAIAPATVTLAPPGGAPAEP